MNFKTNRVLMIALLAIIVISLSAISVFADNGRIFIGDDEEADHLDKAVITEEEAVSIAENHTGGVSFSVELENEDGYLVYGVHVEKDSHKYDVKVDAGTGEVLKVDDDDNDE